MTERLSTYFPKEATKLHPSTLSLSTMSKVLIKFTNIQKSGTKYARKNHQFLVVINLWPNGKNNYKLFLAKKISVTIMKFAKKVKEMMHIKTKWNYSTQQYVTLCKKTHKIYYFHTVKKPTKSTKNRWLRADSSRENNSSSLKNSNHTSNIFVTTENI